MRYAAALAIGMCIGLAAGLAWGRWVGESMPVPAVRHAGDRSAPPVVDQSDYLTNIACLAEYEFFYRRPFASPPELKIVEEGAPPFTGWSFRITEQRANGFKIRFTGTAGVGRNKLRYEARGILPY